MGRFYSGDIEGKFWFGVQGSDDIQNLVTISEHIYYSWKACNCSADIDADNYCKFCYENKEEHINDVKEMDEYADGLSKRWREMVNLAIAGERATLDQMIRDEPLLVNMMVFYGVTDTATLSRLNLRFLLEGKHLCYKCKKELGKFSQKFSVSDVRKFNFKLPRGMTTRDDLCNTCFDKLDSAKRR